MICHLLASPGIKRDDLSRCLGAPGIKLDELSSLAVVFEKLHVDVEGNST